MVYDVFNVAFKNVRLGVHSVLYVRCVWHYAPRKHCRCHCFGFKVYFCKAQYTNYRCLERVWRQCSRTLKLVMILSTAVCNNFYCMLRPRTTRCHTRLSKARFRVSCSGLNVPAERGAKVFNAWWACDSLSWLMMQQWRSSPLPDHPYDWNSYTSSMQVTIPVRMGWD